MRRTVSFIFKATLLLQNTYKIDSDFELAVFCPLDPLNDSVEILTGVGHPDHLVPGFERHIGTICKLINTSLNKYLQKQFLFKNILFRANEGICRYAKQEVKILTKFLHCYAGESGVILGPYLPNVWRLL